MEQHSDPAAMRRITVRYFERPEGYWEGERFPMRKLALLHDKIAAKYGDRVDFRPPSLPASVLTTVEARQEFITLASRICAGEISDSSCDNDPLLIDHPAVYEMLSRIHTQRFLQRLRRYAVAAGVVSRSESQTATMTQMYSDADAAANTAFCQAESLNNNTGMSLQQARQYSSLARAEFETGMDAGVLNNEILDLLGTVAACEDAVSLNNNSDQSQNLSGSDPHPPPFQFHFGFNIGGGNHHSFSDYGHGYCVLNDVNCAIRAAADGYLGAGNSGKNGVKNVNLKVLVIDLDVHQGDGVASLFGPGNRNADVDAYPWGKNSTDLERTVPLWKENEELNRGGNDSNAQYMSPLSQSNGSSPGDDSNLKSESVFLVSLHQENNFPPIKVASHLDTPLDDEIGDAQYLAKLAHTLEKIETQVLNHNLQLQQQNVNAKFDLCIYVAGADPFIDDPLGGINITKHGLRRRDGMVADFCKKHKMPVSVVLAGGYADAEEVADIHFGTFDEMMQRVG